MKDSPVAPPMNSYEIFRRRFLQTLWLTSLGVAAGPFVAPASVCSARADEPPMSLSLVGYNEHRTNLPGGRHANVSTNRAMVVKADGTERRSIGGELVNEAGTWTQFAGWSPDGETAVVLRGWAEQLTRSAEGTLHYHPTPSPDGRWIVYGSKRSGVRNLFVMRLSDRKEHALTNVSAGHAAMHAYWQPRTVEK